MPDVQQPSTLWQFVLTGIFGAAGWQGIVAIYRAWQERRKPAAEVAVTYSQARLNDATAEKVGEEAHQTSIETMASIINLARTEIRTLSEKCEHWEGLYKQSEVRVKLLEDQNEKLHAGQILADRPPTA